MLSSFTLLRPFSRVHATIFGALVLLTLAFTYRSAFNHRSWASLQPGSSSVRQEHLVNFGKSLFAALEQTAPPVRALTRNGDASAFTFWKATSTTPRPDLVPMQPDEVVAMNQAHDSYVEKMKGLRLPYRAGTRGIVSTAGGKYLPIFIISLRMLRRTGCTLPVELLLVTENDHAPYLCDTLLPSLNARCVVLEDYLGSKAVTMAKYQFKVFAILFSSFEDVLFLDADSFLVRDPQDALAQEPFQSAGLVTWPDFWASSASKHLYAVQGIPVPPMTAHASSESGQLIVSKRSHARVLLLATYYNFYGPDHYYQLLSQGGPGQGDKETFLGAAEAMSAPFYQVKKCVDILGYQGEDSYHGTAMLQYDPAHDTPGSYGQDNATPFAVHHNFPKLDPLDLLSADGAAIHHGSGKYHRLIGEKNITEMHFGRDLEQEMWQEMEYVTCELGDKFKHWRALPTTQWKKGTCEMVKEFQKAIFS